MRTRRKRRRVCAVRGSFRKFPEIPDISAWGSAATNSARKGANEGEATGAMRGPERSAARASERRASAQRSGAAEMGGDGGRAELYSVARVHVDNAERAQLGAECGPVPTGAE
jgi:hypothetical protein